MSTKTPLRAALAALTLLSALATVIAISQPAAAQDYSQMSCEELWFTRNEFFANKGYCFKTQRARAAFPRNCFPPHGQLEPWEQDEVQRIEQWESRRGCR